MDRTRTLDHSQVNRTRVGTVAHSPTLAATVTRIKEGGAADSPTSQREECLLCLDISGSMEEPFSGASSKLEAATGAARNFLLEKTKIDPQDRVGLVTFNHSAATRSRLEPVGGARRDMIVAMQGFRPSGGTDLDTALRECERAFNWSDRAETRRIVLLTDGHGSDPLRTAEGLKSRGVVLDVIGIGDSPEKVDGRLLRRVASTVDSELRYVFIRDRRSLLTHFTTIAEKTHA